MANAAPNPAEALAEARRLVVKIGSALLVGDDGEIRRRWLDGLIDDVARCRRRGQELILVSSGAIAIGRRHLGLLGRGLRLEEKQAAAGCLKKLPPLCEAFFQSYESRDVEEIMYLERGLLARLADPAQPSRQARDFAKVLSVRLKNLHERLGLPELKLKLKIG